MGGKVDGRVSNLTTGDVRVGLSLQSGHVAVGPVRNKSLRLRQHKHCTLTATFEKRAVYVRSNVE